MKNCKINHKIMIYSVNGHHLTLFYRKNCKSYEKKFLDFFLLWLGGHLGVKRGQIGGF